MSALDRLNDNELELVALALHKFTKALDHAGLPPQLLITDPERRAVARLLDICPDTLLRITETDGEPA